MIVRVVLAVTCSAAAYTLAQLRNNHARVQPLPKLVREGVTGDDGFNKEIHAYPTALPDSKIQESLAEEKEEEEEEEEVKRVRSCSPNRSFEEDDQILLLPDLDDLLSHGIDIDLDETTNERGRSFPKRKLRTVKTSSRSDFYSYEDKDKGDGDEEDEDDEEAMEIIEAFASQVSSPVGKCSKTPGADFGEILELRMIVAELKEKEKKMEAEYYVSKAREEESRQESEKQLKKKNAEIEKLNGIIDVLEKEVDEKEGLKKDLESARVKFRELQRQMQAEAGNTKANLLMLKQQVAGLQTKEMESGKLDMETEKKLQFLKELEVEVVELRRTSKEVQHEKRELTVKLAAADARIAELSKITEGQLVAEAEAEAAALRHANQDLCKQVEGLQMNRFSEVEELVYLRWVNACLRYELRNSKAAAAASAEASSGALELGNSLSPRSQERAKQLLLEYAGPDLLHRRTSSNSSHRDYPDTDGDDGISSLPTTPSEHGDYDDYSIDNRQSSKKKSGIIRKLKKWGGKAKDTTSTTPPPSSPSSSFSGIRGSPGRAIYHHGQLAAKSPLESLLLRNTSEEVSITSYGMNNHNLEESTSPNNTMPESNVATSFQLMSKSVVGELDEKYPAFKDRHKLALAREQSIKEKAEQARVEKTAANKPKFTIPAERLLQPENPPKTVGKLSDRGVRFEKLPEKDVSWGGVSTRAEKAEISKFKSAEMEKRAPRVPGPPPKPSLQGPQTTAVGPTVGGPPPPPPPPPPRALGGTAGPPPPPPPPGSLGKGQGTGKVQRAPQVVEFYQSLMRRETRSASASTGPADGNISDVHNNLVGEIENRSSFLLAVKADVETQGDFVMSLATEVRAAAYTDIEDVVAFVNWLDEELSFLVDERAVLKHFDWPESKADALREASFEYQDLKKLEMEVTRFEDDRRIPCDRALKKMLSLLEKVEQSVHALLRTRDMTIARHKEFAIPTYWLLDSGVVGKIKLSSVQLAQKYMKRVATELDALHGDGQEKEPLREYLLLQGVRFAFRVHQFAGGFDAESMSVFESLRNQVQAHTTKDQSPMVEDYVS